MSLQTLEYVCACMCLCVLRLTIYSLTIGRNTVDRTNQLLHMPILLAKPQSILLDYIIHKQTSLNFPITIQRHSLLTFNLLPGNSSVHKFGDVRGQLRDSGCVHGAHSFIWIFTHLNINFFNWIHPPIWAFNGCQGSWHRGFSTHAPLCSSNLPVGTTY